MSEPPLVCTASLGLVPADQLQGTLIGVFSFSNCCALSKSSSLYCTRQGYTESSYKSPQTAATQHRETTMATPAPVNVAVIGMGMSTTVFHAPFSESPHRYSIRALSLLRLTPRLARGKSVLSLPEKFNLKVIVERSATPAHSKAREKYPGVQVVNTLDEALNLAEIDAVWICSINDTHYQFAKQALVAGKHVVVEKPVTPTSEQAYELARLARERNLVLAVYQNRRWDADFLTVKKLIAEGRLGDLSEFTVRRSLLCARLEKVRRGLIRLHSPTSRTLTGTRTSPTPKSGKIRLSPAPAPPLTSVPTSYAHLSLTLHGLSFLSLPANLVLPLPFPCQLGSGALLDQKKAAD